MKEFDKKFNLKEKGYSKTQNRFNELVNKYVQNGRGLSIISNKLLYFQLKEQAYHKI